MICFDNRIMDDFRHIHRYYAAVKLAKYLGKNDSIVTNGNELLLEELAKNDDLQTEFRFSNEISDLTDMPLFRTGCVKTEKLRISQL